MPIVCGTDFSTPAKAAATSAAHLAAKLGDELHLVHVPATREIREVPELAEEARRLEALGVKVVPVVRAGAPDEALVKYAEEVSARMVVVGSLGHRGAERWVIGSTSERAALSASVPVLVVRGEDLLGPWIRGERPLSVMLGADFSSTTEAAARRLAHLCEVGPCVIHVTQIVWPPEAHGRYGFKGFYDPERLDPEAEAILVRDLKKRTAALEGKAELHYHVRPGFGRPADHLVQVATRLGVDLLVVGTHQRTGGQRIRYGSVSMGVLHLAPMPVVLVPPEREPILPPVPTVTRVLATTDFSEHGDRATRMAYATAPRGGTVRLVHVVERAVSNPVYAYYAIGTVPAHDAEKERERLGEHLRSLVPAEAEELGIRTEVEVIESKDPAAAIAQAAERFDADVICMGSHGRTGLAKTVLGSVTQGVLARTHRPVLVVRRQEL